MLIVRISITSLSRVPHNRIGRLGRATNQRTPARSSNHLVAVEREHAVRAEGPQHARDEARPHSFRRVLDHRDPILVGHGQYLIYLVRHAVQCHGASRPIKPRGGPSPRRACGEWMGAASASRHTAPGRRQHEPPIIEKCPPGRQEYH